MTYYLVFSVFLLDRICKLLVSVNMGMGESLRILPFFNITYLINSGMAFSIFLGRNSTLLIINGLIAVFLIVVIALSREKKGPAYIAYGMILGGAVSNLWDRIFYGGVIDYIDFRIWPVFNVADTAITAGALLIAYSIIIEMRSSAGRS